MAQNEKGGSDLDIFEGLGKKNASNRPSSATQTVPPPPPAQTPNQPLTPELSKRTLVGMSIPGLSAAPASAAPAAPATRTPPPPPGRASLPPVVGPPAKAPSPQPMVAAGATAAVDVNWDDEDEATHIFDESQEIKPVTAGLGESAPPTAAPSPLTSNVPKATLLGLPLPPGSLSPPGAPRSPPPAGYPLGAAQGFGSLGHPLPPPPATQPGLGLGYSPTRSSAPGLGQAGAPSSIPAPFPRPPGVPDYLAQPHGLEATALVRPPPNRTALWVVVGLVAAAIIAVGVVFSTPHTGRIVINVNDSKGISVNRVEIFIDGKKQCDTAPCLVDQVATGIHEVKVLAEGFESPSVQTVTVEGHKDTSSTFSLGGAKGAGIKVAGTQPGVKLFIDDKEVGPLPQEVHDVAPGDHVVKVAGSERYQPLEKHVSIDKDEVEDLGSITLKVLKGKATINPGTPGARAYLVSGTDRRELLTLPISVDIDTAKTWSLEANKVGFDDYKQAISFDDGQAEKIYTLTLDPRAASASTYVAPPQAAPPVAPAPAPAPAPAAAAAQAPQSGGESTGEAFLNINSIPSSTCFLDGKSLGSTPRLHVSVKPGAHTVKFVNGEQGLTKTLSVSVNAGETKPAVAKLN